MGYVLLRTAGERLADGGVRCCVIRQLDILNAGGEDGRIRSYSPSWLSSRLAGHRVLPLLFIVRIAWNIRQLSYKTQHHTPPSASPSPACIAIKCNSCVTRPSRSSQCVFTHHFTSVRHPIKVEINHQMTHYLYLKPS